MWRAVAVLFLAGFALQSVTAEEPEWQAGISFSYLTGDYGEPSDTDLVYVPITLKRYLERGTVSLSVPYLDLSSDGRAAVVDGTVLTAGGTASSGSGLGDIVIRGLFEAKEQDDTSPFIDLVGKLKLPTGDEDKGLGTGEADIGFGVELTQTLDDGFYLLGELGYTFIGEPSGLNLDNRWNYAIGGGRQVNRDLQLTAMLDGRTALSSGNDDPLSILLFSTWKKRADLLFDTMLELGLNDGSPDIGITVAARKRW